MLDNFLSLVVHSDLVTGLDTLDIQRPKPIQKEAIPILLKKVAILSRKRRLERVKPLHLVFLF